MSTSNIVVLVNSVGFTSYHPKLSSGLIAALCLNFPFVRALLDDLDAQRVRMLSPKERAHVKFFSMQDLARSPHASVFTQIASANVPSLWAHPSLVRGLKSLPVVRHRVVADDDFNWSIGFLADMQGKSEITIGAECLAVDLELLHFVLAPKSVRHAALSRAVRNASSLLHNYLSHGLKVYGPNGVEYWPAPADLDRAAVEILLSSRHPQLRELAVFSLVPKLSTRRYRRR